MNILWTRISFDLLKVNEIATTSLTCSNLGYMLKHED